MGKREMYIEFLFVKPKGGSTLSKLSTPFNVEVDDPKAMVTSALLSAGTFAALGSDPSVVMSCIPMIAPFRTPPVAYDMWASSKRARAFQRSLFLLCSAHGVISLWKFLSGNLIGGFFDMLIAGVGMYASHQDGVTVLPQFLMFAAFNGFMDTLQIIQALHGVPLLYLMFHPAVIRPVLLFTECYLAWNFHKELSACFMGLPSDGPEDSYFVKFFGNDTWSSLPGGDPLANPDRDMMTRSALPQDRPGFSMFGGQGRHLGSN